MSAAATTRPRVVILSFSPIYRDPRVLRQVALLSRTADVVTVGYGHAPEGVIDHVEVPQALAPWRSKRFVGPILLGLRGHHRLYFHSRLVKFVQRAVPHGSMDVVVANDALAAPAALTLGAKGGVHIDLHEYAPRQGESRFMWRLLTAPLMRWACRQVRRADSVTTVAPGIAAEYERRFGFHCAVVPNAPAYRADIAPTPVATPLRLVHIGIAGRDRKLEVMIDAVVQAEAQRPGAMTFDLVLAPGDPTYIAELTAHAAAVGHGIVRVLKPVSFEQIVPTLARYDVGMFVCPPTTFNLAHALPNKFFEFVQARLALVVGPSVEMAPIVERLGLGVVADAFDAAATARALVSLDAASVERFKQASDERAQELSSEELSRPWGEAVARLVEQAGDHGTDAPGADRTDR